MDLENIFSKPTHHFYIVRTDSEMIDFIPKEVSIIKTDLFTIENARRLSSIGLQKTKKNRTTKIAFVCSKITRQAQHSLLKICEEPAERTFIYLIVSFNVDIFPTLISRCTTVVLQRTTTEAQAEKFLALNISQRMVFIDTLWTDKNAVDEFLNSLEVYCTKQEDEKKFNIGEKVYKTRTNMSLSVPTKHILYSLAFA